MGLLNSLSNIGTKAADVAKDAATTATTAATGAAATVGGGSGIMDKLGVATELAGLGAMALSALPQSQPAAAQPEANAMPQMDPAMAQMAAMPPRGGMLPMPATGALPTDMAAAQAMLPAAAPPAPPAPQPEKKEEDSGGFFGSIKDAFNTVKEGVSNVVEGGAKALGDVVTLDFKGAGEHASQALQGAADVGRGMVSLTPGVVVADMVTGGMASDALETVNEKFVDPTIAGVVQGVGDSMEGVKDGTVQVATGLASGDPAAALQGVVTAGTSAMDLASMATPQGAMATVAATGAGVILDEVTGA